MVRGVIELPSSWFVEDFEACGGFVFWGGVVCVCRVERSTLKMPNQYADLKRTWDAIEVRLWCYIQKLCVRCLEWMCILRTQENGRIGMDIAGVSVTSASY